MRLHSSVLHAPTQIMENMQICHHHYVDDTQISVIIHQGTMYVLSKCIELISNCMRQDVLQLDKYKTEVVILEPKKTIKSQHSASISNVKKKTQTCPEILV